MILCLPFCHKDAGQAKALAEWIADLTQPVQNHMALVVGSSKTTDDDIQYIGRKLRKVFGTVYAIRQHQEDERGWPMSCNAMFRCAHEYVSSTLNQPWLWMEPDMVPLSGLWFHKLVANYNSAKSPFMGAIFDWVSATTRLPHLTGCAVYPPNVAKYNVEVVNADRSPWDCTSPARTLPHTARTNLIHHEWGNRETNLPWSFPDQESVDRIHKDAVLFHRCKDGSLISRLRERFGLPVWSAPPPLPPPFVGDVRPLTVVFPFCNVDALPAIRLMEWIAELSPRHKETVLLSYEAGTLHGYLATMRGFANKAFSRIVETSYPPPIKYQWPPNVAFRHAANYVAAFGRTSWLWMEPDAIPLKPQWLEVLSQEYIKGGRPFAGPVVPRRGHMNGTGIYPANTPEYIPRALNRMDSGWDVHMKPEMIRFCHDLAPLYQHVWGVLDRKLDPLNGPSPTFEGNNKHLISQIDPSAVIFHRCKDGSLIKLLRNGAMA